MPAAGTQWFGAAAIDSDIYVVGGQTDVGDLIDSLWLYHSVE